MDEFGKFFMIITIDGPVASGKSTIGRALAKVLGYYYVNSGALYRALAYLLISKKNYSIEKLESPDIIDIQECVDPDRFKYHYDPIYKESITFDGVDITAYLGTSEIGNGASILSTNLAVREEINNYMRALSRSCNLVVDGRDAGTVVFPGADMKFFLTATLAMRMKRWLKAQAAIGNHYTSGQAMEMILERDKRDRERKVAPLIIPEDAIIVDNSQMTRAQTLSYILMLLKSKLGDKVFLKNRKAA